MVGRRARAAPQVMVRRTSLAFRCRRPVNSRRHSPLCRFAQRVMQVEYSILVQAPADRIFRIYQDVAAWHTWDPDTRRASLEGPFVVGTRGSLTPAKGNTVPMLLTKVEPGVCFTVEAKIPLFRMVFEHELVPQAGATKVIHRVTFSGFLTFAIGRMLVKQLHQGLPVTLASLKRLAEVAA